MDVITKSCKDVEFPESTGELSRRAVLVTAAVAAGAATGLSAALAQPVPAASYGVRGCSELWTVAVGVSWAWAFIPRSPSPKPA